MIRILSGLYKGQVLNTPKGNAVRPTTARVRQRVFDTLSAYWRDSIGVDAFAGSGAIGFEALSRGAGKVYATERHAPHLRVIQANQRHLKLAASHYRVSPQSFESWWQAQSDELINTLDWIYLDPPYQYPTLESLLTSILTHPAFAVGAVLIVEHGNHPSEKALLASFLLQKKADVYKQIDCGDTGVCILEKRDV
jgi:16S rRNA (guanine966-N2)-methyltransferase